MDALEQVSTLSDPAARRLCVTMTEQALGQKLNVGDNPVPRVHWFQVVEACGRFPGGLGALAQAVAALEPESPATRHVWDLIASPAPGASLSARDLTQFGELSNGMPIPHLMALCGAAAGPAVPGPFPAVSTAAEALVLLSEFNDWDGLPPWLVFADWVAEFALEAFSESLSFALRTWVNERADQLDLAEPLVGRRRRRPGWTGNATTDGYQGAYLVIQVERDHLDPDLLLISHWRHVGPGHWRPQRGHNLSVASHEVEKAVGELIVATEEAWTHYGGPVRLEFILPRDLLNTPVEAWRTAVGGAHGVPIGIGYPVAVRSLDRIRAVRTHRSWRNRWRTLHLAPENCRTEWGSGPDGAALRLYAQLHGDPQVVALALGAPPEAQDRGGEDEFAIAVQAGLPVMVWHREDCTAPEFADAVAELSSGGLALLPETIHRLRLAAAAREDPRHHPINRVTLLWDDPTRIPDASGPFTAPEAGPAPAPEGDSVHGQLAS